jgi:hypothetical protein
MTFVLTATAALVIAIHLFPHCNITGILSVNFMFGTQTLQLSLNCIITPAIKGHVNRNKG